jgi:DNA-binding transcriptional LysR family regulator
MNCAPSPPSSRRPSSAACARPPPHQAITPQAASQALVQLERHLGVRLFHRTTRSLSLTEEGEQFLQAAQPGLATLQRALHGARRGREEIAGPLRIVAPRSIMLEVLWPVLEEYCRRHPQVDPDIHMDDRIGNWVEDRVDVGFRAGPPPEGGVISRRIVPLQLIVCASPAYIAQHGAPKTIDDLAHHRCTGFRHAGTGKAMPWEFKVGEEVVGRMIASSLPDQRRGPRSPRRGRRPGRWPADRRDRRAAGARRQLVPLLTQHVTEHLGLHVYYGSRNAQPARARAFIDLAVERLVGNTQFFLEPHELVPAKVKGRRRK